MSGELILTTADPEEVDRFRILIESRTRHADLWPLVRQAGSASALADLVGMNQALLGKWINLKSFPSSDSPMQVRGAAELAAMCNKTMDELWPQALKAAIGLGVAAARREQILETCGHQLAASQAERLMLPNPAEVVEEEELRQQVRDALNILPVRTRTILQYRVFDDMDLEEIGKKLHISKERVRLIVMKGIQKLRKRAASVPGLRDIVEQMDRLDDPEFNHDR